MRRTPVRVASGLFLLLTITVLAGACDDDDSEYERDRDRVAAQYFNASQQAPETVTPGPGASPPVITSTATPPPSEYRYATVAPIAAVFDQAKFTTTYALTMTGPFPQGGFVKWSGANCGTIRGDAHSIATDDRPLDSVNRTTFTWVHPHPPCGDTSDHRDATIVATLEEGDGRPGRTPRVITVCTYTGSATGTGPACQLKP